MANIKISELNELYLAQKDYEDYVPIVDSSADETKKISVKNLIPSNVRLIAVTDTAPIEYETGDRYYNTTTNKIYTATSSGWENAQDAIKDILYIVISEQKSYTYDGTTLISVGGGAGGIVVYPNEPEDDTQLYIEEMDLDGNYEVNTETYSTEETLTNKIWVDGKPVYRKTYLLSNVTSALSNIDVTSLNIDKIINLYGMSYNNSLQIPINFYNTGNFNQCYYSSNIKAIQYQFNYGSDAYIIIEYTKAN